MPHHSRESFAGLPEGSGEPDPGALGGLDAWRRSTADSGAKATVLLGILTHCLALGGTGATEPENAAPSANAEPWPDSWNRLREACRTKNLPGILLEQESLLPLCRWLVEKGAAGPGPALDAGTGMDVGTGVGVAKGGGQPLRRLEEGLWLRDLRGVRCPLNFAKARVSLEQLPAGALLQLLIDDGEPLQRVPPALAAEGFPILERHAAPDGGVLLLVQRRPDPA